LFFIVTIWILRDSSELKTMFIEIDRNISNISTFEYDQCQNRKDIIVRRHNIDASSLKMRITRMTANIETSDVEKADAFYHDVLGLERIMDHGWILTYGSNSKMTVQISFASEGGSGTPVPDLSIEVDDIETALARVKKASIPIEYGSVSEPWGVRRFYVRDPFGKLINILQHE